jgi:hypothetical protein
MAGSNRSQKSPACIMRPSGGDATNFKTISRIVRPTVSDARAAADRALKKRSHADRRPASECRSRNGGRSVLGRKVGTIAAAWPVAKTGSPCVSHDHRPVAA